MSTQTSINVVPIRAHLRHFRQLADGQYLIKVAKTVAKMKHKGDRHENSAN